MEYHIKVLAVVIILVATAILVKYNPKFDLVKSYNHYILLLWFNKDGKRDYIILFKL